jgi:hypothetical protein
MAHRHRNLLIAVLLGTASGVCSAQAQLFPFQLPWDDASVNLTNLAWMNSRPAGSRGFVVAGADGHLHAGGQRIRFLGVNFTWRSAAPLKSDADSIARRLARLGINLVRIHLIDADFGGKVIFDRTQPGTRQLDPEMLDRMDYFLARLKENGIYTNFNLLTGRNFHTADGLDPAIGLLGWKEKQTPAMFDPTMIALQKEYARQVLDRVNPYTGIKYTEEPALAFVEVVNEHGLIHAWHGGQMDVLPAVFSNQVRVKWNQHLAAVYGSHSALRDAWTLTTPPGDQMLRNRDFTAGLSGWNVEQHAGALVNAQVRPGQGPSGKPAAELKVTRTGGDIWHVQFNQSQLSVEPGRVYTLSFWAKADRRKTLEVVIEQAHDPWQGLGFSRLFEVNTAWQRFEYTLTLTGADTNARLNLRRMADQVATYWFADLSLAPGGSVGLFPDENLDQRTMRFFFRSEAAQRTEQARLDWAAFLWSLERDYWLQMRDYLKGELGLKALVMGTIVGTSTPNLMALFDAVDSHAYWQHPLFANGWSGPWWYRNSTMLRERDGGTVTALSMKRVKGKPFSVSEYNHPWPLSFGAETMLVLSAYAAFQDWDAIYGYTYADGDLDWRQDRLARYFDLHRDPVKMIGFLYAAFMFRRGDVAAARQSVAATLTEDQERRLIPSVGAWRLMDASDVGVARRQALAHRVELVTGDQPTVAGAPEELPVPETGPVQSDTGELVWDADQGVLVIDTPRTRGVLGYIGGREYGLGDFTIRAGTLLQGWAAVMVSEAGPVSPTRRFLVSALGMAANTGQQWLRYPSGQTAGFPPPADVDLTLGNWGTAPVVVEGIEAEITIPFPPDRVQVFALDGTGSRRSPVEVADADGRSRFQLNAAHRTLWYEVEVAPWEHRAVIPDFQFGSGAFAGIALSNPGPADARIRLLVHPDPTSPFPETAAEVFLAAGRQTAWLLTDLFGTPSASPAGGWLEIHADREEVEAFLQMGDMGLTRLDGLVAERIPRQRLLLTRVHEGAGIFRGAAATTRISVVNPHQDAVRVRLTLNDTAAAGAAPLVLERTLPGGEAVRGTVAELFGTQVAEGHLWLEVLQGDGVHAAGVVEVGGRSLFAVSGATAATGNRLYCPQWARIPGVLFSSLKLVNTSAQSRELTIRVITDEGLEWGQPQVIRLEAGAPLLLDSDSSAFGGGGEESGPVVGSLVIECSGDGIAGDVVFGTEDLSYAAAAPLQEQPPQELLFSHVAEIPGLYFTGLALFNPGPQAAEAAIRVFRPDGTAAGAAVLPLPAGGRISDVLGNLVPGLGRQLGGYILITAGQGLVAQELFGTYRLSLLSAVLPAVRRSP